MQTQLPIHLLVLAALTAPIAAQVPVGQYLAAVRTTGGEMYYVDPQKRAVTKLKISTKLAADQANCVAMSSPAAGIVGTYANPAIYGISLSGTTVTEKKLNTTSLSAGAEISQIAAVGNTVYFAQGSVTVADVWSMPIAGGKATKLIDLTSIKGWRSGGYTNALAANATDVYIGVWTKGEIYVHSIASKTTSLLLTLPASKYPIGEFYPVHMQISSSNELVCLSMYGDVVTIDLTTKKIKSHRFNRSPAGGNRIDLKDSIIENPDTGDWVFGTRDGALDVHVPVGNGQLGRAFVDKVGSGASPTGNRVVALWYNPAQADYKAYGPGCAGRGSFIPTSVARGAPIPGNSGFAFGVQSTRGGTATALLVVGLTKSAPYPIDLTIPGAPGCFLRTDILLLVGTSTTGTPDGWGSGTLAAPLPKIKATIHTQWGISDSTNGFGIVMSDARTLVLK